MCAFKKAEVKNAKGEVTVLTIHKWTGDWNGKTTQQKNF